MRGKMKEVLSRKRKRLLFQGNGIFFRQLIDVIGQKSLKAFDS